MKRAILIILGLLLILVLILFMIVNLSLMRTLSPSGQGDKWPAADAIMTNAAHAQEAVGEVVSRCSPASETQLNKIQAGLDGINRDNYVKTGWAVKSNDYADTYMVSAMIYGPGMEDGVGPGLWGLVGDPDQQEMVYAVDGFALKYSDWPDGSKGDIKLSTLFTDGAQEVMECADPYSIP